MAPAIVMDSENRLDFPVRKLRSSNKRSESVKRLQESVSPTKKGGTGRTPLSTGKISSLEENRSRTTSRNTPSKSRKALFGQVWSLANLLHFFFRHILKVTIFSAVLEAMEKSRVD